MSRLRMSATPPGFSGPRRQAKEAHVVPPRQLERGEQLRARLEPAPGTTRSRRTGALGDTGPRSGAPDGPTGHRRWRSSGDPRPYRDGILEGSRSGLLGRLALFYAILARLRNWPGVTPTRRLK